jgi:hypothetical protein
VSIERENEVESGASFVNSLKLRIFAKEYSAGLLAGLCIKVIEK